LLENFPHSGHKGWVREFCFATRIANWDIEL
jgi:hypothetical protein